MAHAVSRAMFTVAARFIAVVVFLGVYARSSIVSVTLGAICTQVAVATLIFGGESFSDSQLFEYIITVFVVFICATAFWINRSYIVKLQTRIE